MTNLTVSEVSEHIEQEINKEITISSAVYANPNKVNKRLTYNILTKCYTVRVGKEYAPWIKDQAEAVQMYNAGSLKRVGVKS